MTLFEGEFTKIYCPKNLRLGSSNKEVSFTEVFFASGSELDLQTNSGLRSHD